MSTITISNSPSRNFNNGGDLESKIEVLNKERNELRRELCQVIASYFGDIDVDIARERGWDCFENCTQVEGEWLVNAGKA